MASALRFSNPEICYLSATIGILSLYESRSGVLWIGTLDGGLIRVEDGVATTYTEHDGLPSRFISSIRGDVEGKLWFNTAEGVAHFVGTKLEAYPTHRGKAVREFLLQARDGSMWFRSGGDVVRFGADGSIATLTAPSRAAFSSTKLATEASGLLFATGIGWCAITRGYSPMCRYRRLGGEN